MEMVLLAAAGGAVGTAGSYLAGVGALRLIGSVCFSLFAIFTGPAFMREAMQ